MRLLRVQDKVARAIASSTGFPTKVNEVGVIRMHGSSETGRWRNGAQALSPFRAEKTRKRVTDRRSKQKKLGFDSSQSDRLMLAGKKKDVLNNVYTRGKRVTDQTMQPGRANDTGKRRSRW